MFVACAVDEELVRRLPLPLARLYRRAHNAKTPLDRHQAAYFLWEASLKVLSATAVVAWAERGEHSPELAERLQNLARPSLGHWWEFTRLLVPVLSQSGDSGFAQVQELLLGRSRDDLPRTAGLDAKLREAVEGKGASRSTVRLSELFDRLIRYRNRELGHGAAGQRPPEFYERMSRALLAGLAELLGRLDVLAGRQLLFVADVSRQPSGNWLLERHELTGESPRRLDALEIPAKEAGRLPVPGRVYLAARTPALDVSQSLTALHPLLSYDSEAVSVMFLNARRGRHRSEYLCYSSGRVLDLQDLGTEHRELLARVLGYPVDGDKAAHFAARSQAEESSESESESAAAGVPQGSPGGLEEERTTLGEFELLSKLGQGGMGIVYRAWQPSLGRQVALKCLLRTGDSRAEARFAREIRALGRAEHPHLIRAFTSGSDGDRWFYAMELIEGATLAAVCERLQARGGGPTHVDMLTWRQGLSSASEEHRKEEKPLVPPRGAPDGKPQVDVASPGATDPLLSGFKAEVVSVLAGRRYVEHVVELMRQVTEAAHALHQAGTVHRDIKPGNVMVTAEGTHAVLMDLGLAQVNDEMRANLTQTRQFVGTVRYASPEQVLSVGRLDARSDVYSLGATLWEVLTLRPLFGATDQTPTPELMRWIQIKEPEPLRKYNPDVPRDLEAIVLKCLEKDPDKRYPTAQALAEDLARWQRGDCVQARPLGRVARLGRYVRKHRRWVIGIIVLAVLQALLIAGILHLALRNGSGGARPG
jgi:serine/threonine protein kinase